VTPAIEALRAADVQYRLHEYEGVEVGEGDYALAVAAAVGVAPERLFKTLLASVDGKLPGSRGARHGLRRRRHQQRRRLPTTVDESSLEHERILVSAGRRGLQVELESRELIRLTDARVASLTK
jgi:Cys-tRNA(Pro)/Cys-tRNA(Cys) deacylase